MYSTANIYQNYEIMQLTQLLRLRELARQELLRKQVELQAHDVELYTRRRQASGGSAASDCSSPAPSVSSIGSWDSSPASPIKSPGLPFTRPSDLRTQVPQLQSQQRYKTEMCRQFAEGGNCKYGDKCQFAHGSPELRVISRHPKYKTDMCRNFNTTGFCPYGPRCHYVHNVVERRDVTGPGLVGRPILAAAKPAAATPAGLEQRLQEVALALTELGLVSDSDNTWSATGGPNEEVSRAVASMIATTGM